MIVYRVGRTKHARDLSGDGAKINGGRWNRKDVPCVYTSESRALSLLEYTVNVNIEEIPRALSIASIEIRDSDILVLQTSALPGDWKEVPAPSSTKDFGSRLLRIADKPVIKIPSSILEQEYNYILNPLLIPNLFKIIEIKDLVYDIRIKIV